MKLHSLTRQQFKITYNRIEADVFFFIDQTPFILAFGIVHTSCYFEIQVFKGFQAKNFQPTEIYKKICNAFDIKFDRSHTFTIVDFLTAINRKIPQNVHYTTNALPQSIAKYRRDIEESDKIYFLKFVSHINDGKHVTMENLRKTRILMGEQAYQRCKSENISTCWTDDKHCDHYHDMRGEEGRSS
jgi:hypothetical protein